MGRSTRDFAVAVKNAAEKLSDKEKKVRLELPFNGFFVSLDKPEEKFKNFELTKFREIAIERDGEFYLVAERMMGKIKKD